MPMGHGECIQNCYTQCMYFLQPHAHTHTHTHAHTHTLLLLLSAHRAGFSARAQPRGPRYLCRHPGLAKKAPRKGGLEACQPHPEGRCGRSNNATASDPRSLDTNLRAPFGCGPPSAVRVQRHSVSDSVREQDGTSSAIRLMNFREPLGYIAIW